MYMLSVTAMRRGLAQDLGEIGEDLSALVVELKNMDQEEKKGLFGASNSFSNSILII